MFTCGIPRPDGWPDSQKGMMATLTEGAAGVMQAACGINRADDETVSTRRAICNGCEHRIKKFGVATCGKCGCFIVPKTTLKDQTCPIGKW
jgi:hypothetical protein